MQISFNLPDGFSLGSLCWGYIESRKQGWIIHIYYRVHNVPAEGESREIDMTGAGETIQSALDAALALFDNTYEKLLADEAENEKRWKEAQAKKHSKGEDLGFSIDDLNLDF